MSEKPKEGRMEVHLKIQERIHKEFDEAMSKILDEGETAEFAMLFVVSQTDTRIVGGGWDAPKNSMYILLAAIQSLANELKVPPESILRFLEENAPTD